MVGLGVEIKGHARKEVGLGEGLWFGAKGTREEVLASGEQRILYPLSCLVALHPTSFLTKRISYLFFFFLTPFGHPLTVSDNLVFFLLSFAPLLSAFFCFYQFSTSSPPFNRIRNLLSLIANHFLTFFYSTSKSTVVWNKQEQRRKYWVPRSSVCLFARTAHFAHSLAR